MKSEKRYFRARLDLINAIKEYFKACEEIGYDFKDDIHDVIWDATEGKVDI